MFWNFGFRRKFFLRVIDIGGVGVIIFIIGIGVVLVGRIRRSWLCLGSLIFRIVGVIVNNFILLIKYLFLYCMFYGCIINLVFYVIYMYIVCFLCICIYVDLLFNFYSVIFLKYYFIIIYNFVE